MKVWKWFCFILICADTVSYIINKSKEVENVAGLMGLMTGITARGCALYGLVTYWLLA
jgi:hypothetical protein